MTVLLPPSREDVIRQAKELAHKLAPLSVNPPVPGAAPAPHPVRKDLTEAEFQLCLAHPSDAAPAPAPARSQPAIPHSEAAQAIYDALWSAAPAPAPAPQDEPGPTQKFGYTNWRSEHAVRDIAPIRLFWGSTEWHPEPQWLLEAWDVEKSAVRVFALGGFGSAPQPGREEAKPVAWRWRRDGSSRWLVQNDALPDYSGVTIEPLYRHPAPPHAVVEAARALVDQVLTSETIALWFEKMATLRDALAAMEKTL